jgi:hypothetical protein
MLESQECCGFRYRIYKWTLCQDAGATMIVSITQNK